MGPFVLILCPRLPNYNTINSFIASSRNYPYRALCFIGERFIDDGPTPREKLDGKNSRNFYFRLGPNKSRRETLSNPKKYFGGLVRPPVRFLSSRVYALLVCSWNINSSKKSKNADGFSTFSKLFCFSRGKALFF